MPAAVEVYQDMAAFASRRVPAWHMLGTVFDEDVTTTEMLELAHLNGWNVHLEEIQTPYPFYKTAFYVVRTNPFTKTNEVLGIVGERYNEYQNEELLEFGSHIQHGGGRWETAGSIKNGTVVFASMALEFDKALSNGDEINSYLLLHTSHDGSLSVQASITPVRVVCANTLDMALQGVKQSFKIRHTQAVTGKVQQARESLGLAQKYMDEFSIEAQALIEAQVTKDQFFDIVEAMYPKPEKDVKGALTKWQNKSDLLEEIWNSETNDSSRNTAWGALNTLTERLDWFRSPRKGNTENLFAASSGFDPVLKAEKAKAFKVVKAFAGIK